MQQKGCRVIHAEGDADADITKTAVTASSYSSITLIGKCIGSSGIITLLPNFTEGELTYKSCSG